MHILRSLSHKGGVPPGHLTERGGQLMTLFGGYYGECFAQQGLLHPTGCGDSSSISFPADSDQRTVTTGKALAASMFPGCSVMVQTLPSGTPGLLFHTLASGVGRPSMIWPLQHSLEESEIPRLPWAMHTTLHCRTWRKYWSSVIRVTLPSHPETIATGSIIGRPPLRANVFVPGCSTADKAYPCPWSRFTQQVLRAINPVFVQ